MQLATAIKIGSKITNRSTSVKSNNSDFAKQILLYQNPDLLERIMEKENLTKDEAQILMCDMLQFLFVAGTGDGEVFAPTSTVDTAWHNFILFTKDYSEFCHKNFGKFIHHIPNTKSRLHLVGNGTLPKTIRRVREVFGSLSYNWTGKSDCESASCVTDCTQCSGHTNCNSKD